MSRVLRVTGLWTVRSFVHARRVWQHPASAFSTSGSAHGISLSTVILRCDVSAGLCTRRPCSTWAIMRLSLIIGSYYTRPNWSGQVVLGRCSGPACGGTSRRDGFAGDCPHRHPVRPMLALRNRSGAAPSFFCECRAISTVAGAAPRRRDTSGARWRRYAGDRLAGRFPWSGWGARESLPGHPSHGRRIGPRHGPILSPSPSVVAPARVASRGHPGLSRLIPG